MKKEEFVIGDLIWRVNEKLLDYFRLLIWKILLGKIGRGSYIKGGVRIDGNPKRIAIGNNFKIWDNCFIGLGVNSRVNIGNEGLLGVGTYINCSSGNLTIGNGVAIAPYCRFFTYSHNYLPGKSITETYKVADIVIEDDVLIGSNVTILPGITIKKGAIVAAGAVVTKDVEAYTIVAGIPAKRINSREI